VKKDKNNPNALPHAYVVEYLDKGKGIRWYARFNDELSEFMQPSIDPRNPNYQIEPRPYSIKATINPKLFTGIRDYITAASSDCIDSVEEHFNAHVSGVSSVLGEFADYSMNRTDYCLNIDPIELNMGCTADQFLKLAKRADIPRHFKEQMKYSKKSHRMKPFENDFRLNCNSLTISCYYKFAHLLQVFSECPDLEKSRNIIRFEVKYKYPKTYALSRSIREALKKELSVEEAWDDFINGSSPNPMKLLLSDDLAADVVTKYFNKVIRKGDYFTLEGARWMVQSQNFRRDKEDRLFFALDVINKHRGIAKAKSKLTGIDLKEFKRSLKDLDAIFVNPVTIPSKWNIPHIINPLRAYYKGIYAEQLITKDEYMFERLLAEYLSN